MKSKPDISIVVPVYNSAPTLHELAERIDAVARKMNWEWELLLIDDGSSDPSWTVILELKKKYPEVLKGYKLACNCGQQIATLCGLRHAVGHWAVTLDDDLQCMPEEIPHLLLTAQRMQADLVYGTFAVRRRGPLYNIATRLFRIVLRQVAPRYPDGSSFRLISGAIVQALPPVPGPMVFVDPMLGWLTSQIATVQVQHNMRKSGQSNYSFLKLINLALSVLIIHSTIPLRLMIWAGFFSALVSFGLGIYFFVRKLTVGAELGFSALIVTMTFAFGIILICLGILGEYISRIYTMGTGRPVFTVKAIA